MAMEINRLTDIKVKERSLVDFPANKRRFLIIKKDHNMPQENPKETVLKSMTERMKKMAALADEIKAVPEGENIPEALTKSLAELLPVKTEKTDAEKAVEAAAIEKAAVEKAAAEKVAAEKAAAAKDKDQSDVLKALPEEQRVAIAKMVTEAVAKSTEALSKQVEGLETEKVELTTRVNDEVDRRELGEQIDVAKRDYGDLPGAKPDELGAIFQTLGAKVPEELKKIQEILKGAGVAIAKGNLYGEIAPQNGQPAPDSWEGLVAARAAEIQKSDVKISDVDARIMATKKLAKEEPGAYAGRNERN